MLRAAKASEFAVHHDRKASAQCLAFFHRVGGDYQTTTCRREDVITVTNLIFDLTNRDWTQVDVDLSLT